MEKTRQIAIYGKSGHGKVLADMAKALGYTEVIWVDDDEKKDAFSFLVFLEFYHTLPIVLGMGNNSVRELVMDKLKGHGLNVATLVHPSAVISPHAQIGEGSVVMANVVVNADAVVGKGVILNTACVIEHDNRIDDFVHVSPRAALAGDVHVKRLAHIGIGASIIQGKSIGAYSVIGAGAAVISDIDDEAIAVGVPAVMRKRNNG